MKWTVFAVLLALLAGSVVGVACSATPDKKRETCGNGIDDDDNGLIDCFDPDCSGQFGCPVYVVDAGYWGTCAKCGQACSSQSDCVSALAVNDRPMAQCTAGKCGLVNSFIQVRVLLDTKISWAGQNDPRSGITRFIKKTALDGTTVSCATIAAVATDRTHSDVIEASRKFNLQGIDVTPVQNNTLGQGVKYDFVNTGTGDNFLIWTEFWSGGVDSNTKLPSGKRAGYGCFESSADVGGPLVLQDNCPSATNDAGTCRTFNLKMPQPEP